MRSTLRFAAPVAAVTLCSLWPSSARAVGSRPAKSAPVRMADLGPVNRPPGHALLFDPAAITETTLPNGVRCVIKATRGTGLVAVQVWVRAGSRFETSGNEGVSHLVETVAMASSRNYPRSAANASIGGASGAIAGIGGTASSETSRDATNYSATVAAPYLPAAMRALADATLHPRLTDDEVENAKVDVEGDLQRRGSDPIATTADMAYAEAFAKHPYRFPAEGDGTGIDKLNGAIARNYHSARYVGSNISVIVVGDVRSATADKLIAHYFAEAPKQKTNDTVAPETRPAVYRNVERKRPGVRTALALGFRSPGMATPTDVVATDVLLSYWSEGPDAKLRQVLLGKAAAANQGGADGAPGDDDSPQGGAPPRVQPPGAKPAPEPLAYGFDVNFLTQRDPGLLIFSLVVDPDKKPAAIAAVLKEIARVKTQGLSASDLAAAKLVLKRQYIQQSETVTGQAGALGFYEMIDNYSFAVTYLDRIDRITSGDIKRLVAKYMTGNAYVQASIEPSVRLNPDDMQPGEDTVPA